MPDCVHAAVDEVQPAAPDSTIDGLGAETEVQQLTAGDHAILRPRERSNLAVRGALTSHVST
jgi:hypothetical protein